MARVTSFQEHKPKSQNLSIRRVLRGHEFNPYLGKKTHYNTADWSSSRCHLTQR